MTWERVERNYHGYQIYVKEHRVGTWIASLSQNPDPGEADVIATPGSNLVPGEYSSKEHTFHAAQVHLDVMRKKA